MLIGLTQQIGKLVFVGMVTGKYLPPGGRGTAKRWMRNGDRCRILSSPNSSKFVQMLYRNSYRCGKFQVSPFLIRPFGAPSPRGKVLLSVSPSNINLSYCCVNPIRIFSKRQGCGT